MHGSQGCVAYFRTYFNRHFKEPCSCVSDSMTEDAAVFGGQKNMFDGLENAKAIYQPEIIAVPPPAWPRSSVTTQNAFIINNAKKAGHIPQDHPVPFAHTPSFVGSHTTGWDNMEEGILRYFTLNHMEGKKAGSNSQRQPRPRFRNLPRQLPRHQAHADRDGRRLHHALRPDRRLRHPADGEFRMYAGGTTIGPDQGCAERHHHRAAPALAQLEKTKKFVENTWNHEVPKLEHPHGRRMDRRVPDEGFRADRQADPAS